MTLASSSKNKKFFTDTDRVLEKHALRKTPLRRAIIMAFMSSKKSMTQADLLESLPKFLDSFDRVSVYRNLSQLKEVGLLHELEVNNYVYCSHECDGHAHLLLYCSKCHKHQEIKNHDEIDSFMTELGRFKFFGKTQPVFLKGICTRCA